MPLGRLKRYVWIGGRDWQWGWERYVGLSYITNRLWTAAGQFPVSFLSRLSENTAVCHFRALVRHGDFSSKWIPEPGAFMGSNPVRLAHRIDAVAYTPSRRAGGEYSKAWILNCVAPGLKSSQ
jgi:hypothetical protein